MILSNLCVDLYALKLYYPESTYWTTPNESETEMSQKNDQYRAAIGAYASICTVFTTLTVIFICIDSAGSAAVCAFFAAASFFATIYAMFGELEQNLRDYIRSNNTANKS